MSWLLRQLQHSPDGLRVEARIARSSQTLAAALSSVRTDPSILYPEKGKEIKGFSVSATSAMGTKRDNSRGSFAEGVMTGAEAFYEQVLQQLRPWKATPPQLRKPQETEPEEVVAEAVGVEPGQIADIRAPEGGPLPASGDPPSGEIGPEGELAEVVPIGGSAEIDQYPTRESRDDPT